MTQGKDMNKDLARLEEVLEVFGANTSRWPVTERAALEVLVETQNQARQLFDEMQALERVMDVAPTFNASDALKTRIVTAAITNSDHEPRVIPIRPASVDEDYSYTARRVTAMWPAAALAASLALGLYLGVSGVGGQAFESAIQISSISNVGDSNDISWVDDGNGSDAEDLL